MVIRQGDVLDVDLGRPVGSAPGYRRPAVVVQSDQFNRTRLATVVVVPVTSNLRRATMPGNVPLAKGEGNLRMPSVANVTQVVAIDRSQVIRRIGTLPRFSVREIVDGIALVLGADQLRG